MNILMLNFEFPPLGGGAGNATFYLLKELARYDDVHIDVVVSSAGAYREEQFSPRIKIHFLDIGKSDNWHYQSERDLLSYAWKSFFFCQHLLKKNTYHLGHAFFGIPCGFIALRLGIPYIVSLRGSDVPYYNPRFYWWDSFLFKRLSKSIWRKAKRVISNSYGLKMLAQQSFPDQRIDVIGNGIDTAQFAPGYTSSEALRILCVSRLIARKGIDDLLKAMAELKQEKITLQVVGNGNQKEKLTRMTTELGIKEKVSFLDYLSHDAMSGIYHQNDVFVLPSLNEGMSNAALEAMACGLPIVLTDTGGTKELVQGNGFIVPKQDPAGLVATLKEFLFNRSLVKKMGARSRELAEQMSWPKVARAYYAVYKSILDNV
ncbi:MAG: glycosyltransferase family 4 protein [Candidatus Omnitrophota bacterium]